MVRFDESAPGLLPECDLIPLAAKAVGLVVEWSEALQAFAVVSGRWPRLKFCPLDCDADAFLLPCCLPDLPVDLILHRAHEGYNQSELRPHYVRRNLVRAAARRGLMTQEELHARGW